MTTRHPNQRLYDGEADNPITALHLYIAALQCEITVPGEPGDNDFFDNELAKAQKALAIIETHIAQAIQEMQEHPDIADIMAILNSSDYSQLAF